MIYSTLEGGQPTPRPGRTKELIGLVVSCSKTSLAFSYVEEAASEDGNPLLNSVDLCYRVEHAKPYALPVPSSLT